MLRTVTATRYATPLREGGSLPAIVEADDLGLYVAKFRGAGQGVLALAAELIAGEIGRAVGIAVPELVFIEIDAALGRNEPDWEIRELLNKSTGQNLAMDYLPGSVMFDPAARDTADPDVASAAVWFDAFIMNVDRTASNPNLLWWHKKLWFIDHGAALYFHHNWPTPDRVEATAASPFSPIAQHVLLPWASKIAEAGERIASLVTTELLTRVLDQVPDNWLVTDGTTESPHQRRSEYLAILRLRLQHAHVWQEAAVRARSLII